MTDWLFPALCGLLTGILSSWGVGGGTLLLLCMTLFFGVEQRTAQAINLLYFLPTAGISLFAHRKNGYLDKAVLRAAIPTGTLCALAAAFLTTSRSGCSCSTRGCRSSLKRRKTAKKKRRDFRHGVFDSIQMRSAVSSAI